jgi:hypothetical protein
MPKINVIIKGDGSKDHTLKSPQLSQGDADSQLDQIGKLIGEGETLELPWIRVAGYNIISANQIADPAMPRVV